MAWVRWRTSKSRVRNTTAAACACSLFTATKRMVGRCAASQIASAGHVILLPLDERLHVRRRDEADRVAELSDLTPPVVGARTSLHGHRAGRERGQEREELAAAQLLAKDHRARAVGSVQLKDVLGEIESDGAHLVHGRLLEWPATPSLWHTTAAGGVHTITATCAACRSTARAAAG